MPGAYAHLTLVNFAREPDALEAAGIPTDAISALMTYGKYCDLGAVSPDYPYLAITHPGQQRWADSMHYDRTCAVIAAGMARVRRLHGETKQKCLAWLLGYAAHVTTDMSIHPVVELKVGPYAQNKAAHRICEMHQDAYIFGRLDVGGIEYAEFLDHRVSACASDTDPDRMDEDISAMWKGMLAEVYPGAEAPPPNPDAWHRGFRRAVDKIAESGRRLFPLARHVAQGLGITYPLSSGVDDQYIRNLATPRGVAMSYDEIFDRTTANVRDQWKTLALDLVGDRQTFVASAAWNLDTGRDGDQYVYWEVA